MHSKETKPKKAVALKYSEEMTAPQVVATGQGTLAEKIIAMAEQNGVLLKEDPVLVDALSQLDVGQDIPPELYKVVAEILVFLMNMDKKKR